MESADPVLYSVVAVDVEGYSGQPGPEQLDLRRHLGEVLTAACDAAGIDRARWQRQDMGDGELALVPADVSPAQLVIALGHALAAALRQHNLFRGPEGRMRLRVAVHQGAAVVVDATGFAGNAVVEAARLLNSPQLRAALTDVPDADLVLIVSDRTYQDLLRDDPPGLDRAAFRLVHVAVKGFEADAWLNVLRYADRVGPIVGRVASQRLEEVRAAYVQVSAFEQLLRGLEQYRVQVLCGAEGTGRSTTALRALDELAETVSVLDPETDLRQLTGQDLKHRHGYLLDTSGGDSARRLSLALLGHLREVLERADADLVLIVDSPAWLEEHAWAEYLVWYHGPDPRELLYVHLGRLLGEGGAATPDQIDEIDELLANEAVNSALRNASGPRQVVDLAARLARGIRDGLAPEQILLHGGEHLLGQNGQQAGLQPEEALAGLSVDDSYQPEPRIARDYWTPDDSLGYDQYADAIAAFIRHDDTRPPLTIGIKAPWGAGKTSLMRMVQERLDPPEDRGRWSPTRLRLTGDARDALLDRADAKAPVTILELLRRTTQGSQAGDADLETLDVDPPETRRLREPGQDWRPTVWFNPWMYQSGEQVWAGLAHEIISQVSGRLEAGDRERFWLALNLRRIDRQAVRRRIYRVLAERLLPLVFGIVAAVIVVAATLLLAWLLPAAGHLLRIASAAVVSVGTAGGLVEAARRGLRYFKEEAAGPFRSLVGEPNLAAGSKKLLADEAKGVVDQLVRDPGYEARLGFLYLVQTDMRRVLDLVATERRPLVVFVDDLDRCSPSTVAQVIEAVNLFLAGEFPNCIFVLAVEPAMVAAHVEVAYKDLVDSLKRGRLPGQWSTLGWRFLEKIVQLPLSLPLPADGDQGARYLDSLLTMPVVRATTPMAPAAPPDSARPREPADRQEPTSDGLPAQPLDAAPNGGPSGMPAAAGPDRDATWPGLVWKVEKAIRRRSPTVRNLPDIAREAQDDVFGEAAERLRPETMEAANRVFAELYSDASARDAIAAALPKLDSQNPREIKRFINLFRFYTFITQQHRLGGAAVPTGRQIAKLAILAIRWPQLLNALGRKVTGDGASTVLAHLEQRARSRDGRQTAGEATQSDRWCDALVEVGLAADVEELSSRDFSWAADFRHFLDSEPSIAAAAERLL